MPLHIDQVITPTTAEEIEQAVLDLCATGGLSTSSWQPGSMIRTFIKEQSAAFAAKEMRNVEIAKGGFGDLGSGIWVKYWAQTIYNVIFIPAAPATGYLKARNTGITTIDLDPGDLTVAHKVTGKTYRNQNIVSIPSGGAWTPNDAIAISSDELGTLSDAAPGDVEVVVNGIPGLEVTNVEPVLGADEEANEALVKRTRAKLGGLSPNGPKAAYDFVATTPLDSFPVVEGTLLAPTSSPITRANTTADRNTGNVVVYIATATGAASSPDCDKVTAAFYRWAEPWCVDSVAEPAVEVVIPITYQVWIRTSFTAAQVRSAVGVALARYIAGVDVGGIIVSPNTGRVYIEALQYIIRTALPGIELVAVTIPAADVAIAPNEVPVLGGLSGEVTFL